MTQEDKNILLKDLCSRLPYGVKCSFISSKGDVPSTIVKIDVENGTVSHKPDGQSNVYFHWIESGYIKPYLRPMSSMTEKENEELKYVIELGLQALEGEEGHNTVSAAPAAFEVDFYNKHHFDYRGLIPMGLALEAPDDMYK